MTASLNRVQLIGNLGADPKSITGKDGQSFSQPLWPPMSHSNRMMNGKPEWNGISWYYLES